jgi:hypothetical protein
VARIKGFRLPAFAPPGRYQQGADQEKQEACWQE